MLIHTNQPLITSFHIKKVLIFCRISDESALIRTFLRNERVRVKPSPKDYPFYELLSRFWLKSENFPDMQMTDLRWGYKIVKKFVFSQLKYYFWRQIWNLKMKTIKYCHSLCWCLNFALNFWHYDEIWDCFRARLNWRVNVSARLAFGYFDKFWQKLFLVAKTLSSCIR